jgi:hypothetical protein
VGCVQWLHLVQGKKQWIKCYKVGAELSYCTRFSDRLEQLKSCIRTWGECWYAHKTGWSRSLCAPDGYNTEHYLAQSDCLAADRLGQRDTRLTLTPSVICNANYVNMVSDWNCLKYLCMFLCTVIIRGTETFWSLCIFYLGTRVGRVVSFTLRGNITQYTLSRKLNNHKGWLRRLEEETNQLPLSEIEREILRCPNPNLVTAPIAILNPFTPELNPSAQRCLTRLFTGGFASWTVHFVNICV